MNKRHNFYYLPKKYHSCHQYCDYILNQIEQLTIGNDFKKLRQWNLQLSPEHILSLQQYDGDVLSFLEDNKLVTEAEHTTARSLLNALIKDTCYFLQEGFECSLKMRLTVSFTLFRKPFSEMLIIYLRLLLEEEFLKRFSSEKDFNPINLAKDSKLQYLNIVNSWVFNIYNVEELYEFFFDKSSLDNLYNIGNHAIHLHTSRNPTIKTQQQNLNFIFSQEDDIENQWEYIYSVLPMLLSFLADVIDFNVIGYADIPDYIMKKRFLLRNQMRRYFKVE